MLWGVRQVGLVTKEGTRLTTVAERDSWCEALCSLPCCFSPVHLAVSFAVDQVGSLKFVFSRINRVPTALSFPCWLVLAAHEASELFAWSPVVQSAPRTRSVRTQRRDGSGATCACRAVDWFRWLLDNDFKRATNYPTRISRTTSMAPEDCSLPPSWCFGFSSFPLFCNPLIPASAE